MDLSIITTEALQAELKRRNVEANQNLQKRDFIKLAEEKKLTDEDIVLIADTFRDTPLLWSMKEAEKRIGFGRAALNKMSNIPGCPVVRKGNEKFFIASRMVDWLMEHAGEDIMG